MKSFNISNFGENVFNEVEMKKVLPKKVYADFKESKEKGYVLDLKEANVIAEKMKEWAIKKGATHYTHWFQPLTGITAEKHDSFVDTTSDGRGIMEFSGKELIKGEPDASSFPNGGLRNTFEARGYTAWDLNSYAFVKGKVLYIPTAFCSYSGEALDKKTPLLRSIEVLNREAVRLLKICGDKKVKKVIQYAGPEQEYFLIDEKIYNKRMDLKYCGRTLFGARSIKGQELSDHYFGIIKPRIQEFMEEVNEELWRLGIVAKTEHNEVAPSQHEIAVKFMPSNIATDQNQLIMELMPKIAKKYNMVCLLNEKPFENLNGSGKHNNWSIGTDYGKNLLSPGNTYDENIIFLLFIVIIIKSVDDYQDLLRLSVATASNDNRLGGNEAPPAIISIFLGEELTDILLNIEKEDEIKIEKKSTLNIGVKTIPNLIKDISDRNRTSPFAFTGNKFEFRMLGSSNSIACANMMLNTAVAGTIKKFADYLEDKKDIKKEITKLIKTTIKEHKKIIFNGNGYDKSWIKEAKKRQLENLTNTPDAVETINRKKNIDLLTSTKVMNKSEIQSRYEITLENYCKTIIIEARCMIDVVMRSILPSVNKYSDELVKNILDDKEVGLKNNYILEKTKYLIDAINKIFEENKKLDLLLIEVDKINDIGKKSKFICKKIVSAMKELRDICDKVELNMPYDKWPMPTYNELLFSI